jgi:hypothetical protein
VRFRLPINWLLFFLISFGLGYPTLNRFDARNLQACDSSSIYSKLVTGEPSEEGFQWRVLVPWVARPFFWLAQGRTRSWNPVAFSLLISNSIFTASGSLLLLLLGRNCLAWHSAAFAGTLLYLLNFTISNRQLGCGLVESGEACFMLALFWLLFERKFFLLPVVGLLGALAKESFVPMSFLATVGWAIFESRHGRWKLPQTLWALGMVLVGLSTITVLLFNISGRLIWPWEFAREQWAGDASLFQALLGIVFDRYFWYVFVWLLPLGAVDLKRFPGAWICASIGGTVAALAMGAWNNAAGNTVPSIFNSIGPILSLSAARFLVGSEKIPGVPPQAS